ncbi:MAG: hypothetical protein EOP84_14100 [Verrucomicrobiaceae bacterium]|nr:MAG: hypothetical protein EOP84_14100 [Verrucomicrobiaceae bacterium]
MVEQTRQAQIDNLLATGWTRDAETDQFDRMSARQGGVGDPEYLRGPDGRVCACSCGQEVPVDGPYPLTYSAELGERMTYYRDGRAIFAQG